MHHPLLVVPRCHLISNPTTFSVVAFYRAHRETYVYSTLVAIGLRDPTCCFTIFGFRTLAPRASRDAT